MFGQPRSEYKTVLQEFPTEIWNGLKAVLFQVARTIDVEINRSEILFICQAQNCPSSMQVGRLWRHATTSLSIFTLVARARFLADSVNPFQSGSLSTYLILFLIPATPIETGRAEKFLSAWF